MPLSVELRFNRTSIWINWRTGAKRFPSRPRSTHTLVIVCVVWGGRPPFKFIHISRPYPNRYKMISPYTTAIEILPRDRVQGIMSVYPIPTYHRKSLSASASVHWGSPGQSSLLKKLRWRHCHWFSTPRLRHTSCMHPRLFVWLPDQIISKTKMLTK